MQRILGRLQHGVRGCLLVPILLKVMIPPSSNDWRNDGGGKKSGDSMETWKVGPNGNVLQDVPDATVLCISPAAAKTRQTSYASYRTECHEPFDREMSCSIGPPPVMSINQWAHRLSV